MADQPIRFDDGATYEQMMGIWSRLAGDIFLDWLKPTAGLRWIDIGCGNGAFTERLVERYAPAGIEGVDPSDGQLAYARSRHKANIARFTNAGAMELPFPAHSFDAAVMALVIFFVSDPAKGVSEMRRVVRPGGSISAYAWDVLGGALPHQDVRDELREMGHPVPLPPSVEASHIDNLHRLWVSAGLDAIETRTIEVQRTYADFDEYWRISLLGPGASQTVKNLTSTDLTRLKDKLRSNARLDSVGRITSAARANAVKGKVPG